MATLRVRAARVLLVVAILAALGYGYRGRLLSLFFGSEPPPERQRGLALEDLPEGALTVVAEGLEVPWEMVFPPEGGILVTERPGRLVWIVDDVRRSFPVPGVRQAGEGGLMGLALHPGFAQNRWIYLCLTTEGEAGLENRVQRHRFEAETGLSRPTILLQGIPGAHFHDGCRLGFGPDGHLFITTGDAGDADQAQDPRSLAGKILRVADDGSIPDDNPFGNPVYSYGHRNPQGLAWDNRGRLWSTEHGRSGFASGYDELNRIERGGNYGWPVRQGDEDAAEMTPPALHSGPDYTWAPSAAAYWNGRILFGGLRGEALFEVDLSRNMQLHVHFHSQFGRIRAVRLGPDGMLYFTTSNRDGRGRARSRDDRILRLDLATFQR